MDWGRDKLTNDIPFSRHDGSSMTSVRHQLVSWSHANTARIKRQGDLRGAMFPGGSSMDKTQDPFENARGDLLGQLVDQAILKLLLGPPPALSVEERPLLP